MPSKGTPRHAIRIDDELWQAAMEKARAEGVHLSDIIRDALRTYVEDDTPPQN